MKSIQLNYFNLISWFGCYIKGDDEKCHHIIKFKVTKCKKFQCSFLMHNSSLIQLHLHWKCKNDSCVWIFWIDFGMCCETIFILWNIHFGFISSFMSIAMHSVHLNFNAIIECFSTVWKYPHFIQFCLNTKSILMPLQ